MRSGLPLLAALAATTSLLARPAGADELDGRWLLHQVAMTVTEVPMLGPLRVATTTVTVHDVTSDGQRLRSKGQLCDVTIIGDRGLLTTTVPPRLRRVLAAPALDAKLERVNGRLTLFDAPPPVFLGARVKSPDDEVPTVAEDPRVYDQDLDGKPGVTLKVVGMAEGDIHLVQRSWTRLDGVQQDDGSFAGVVRHGLVQTVLDATAPMLRHPPPNVPTVEGSTFRLVRLPAGGCPEALAQAKAWTPAG